MGSITIQKIDITALQVDAIVNAANEGLWAGGGVCGAIFRAAGMRELQDACGKIGGCKTGSAVITPGFALPASFVIHAVGPIWNGGSFGERDQLYGAYASSLALAVENGCKSIAFPLISSGIYGYPVPEAWEVAISACKDFLASNDISIVFAVLTDDMKALGESFL